jgi:hypothetical protein
MQIEKCDIAIASRIKTALEQCEGASNAIHLAAQIAAVKWCVGGLIFRRSGPLQPIEIMQAGAGIG